VRTYTVSSELTLSIEDEVIQRASAKAAAVGTSVNQLIRD